MALRFITGGLHRRLGLYRPSGPANAPPQGLRFGLLEEAMISQEKQSDILVADVDRPFV